MKKLLQSLFVPLRLALPANAKHRTTAGTATSQDDRLPIPGVNVKAERRQVGTQTGSDGKFSLNVFEVFQKNSITHLALLI